MKTMRISIPILFTILFSLIISEKSRAQLEVSWDALRTHSVDFNTEYGKEEGAVYYWQVTGGTTTDLLNVTASSVDIIWDGDPGEYELSVFVVDGNGCQSETIIQKINVLDESTLLFEDEASSPVLCSVLSEEITSGLDQIIFTVNFNSGIAPYSLTYRIVDSDNNLYDNQGNPSTENIVENGIATSTYEIKIENGFLNDTDQDQVYKVEILEAKTSDGANVTLDENMQIFTICKKPMIQNLKMH